MGNVRRFSAINTKLRVMRSRFLKDEDYVALMKKESVIEQVKHLISNTAYGQVLEDVEEYDDIQAIELELEKFHTLQFEKILNYFSDDYEKYLKSYLLRHEVEDLKIFLRALARGESLEKYNQTSVTRKKYYSFSYDQIKNAKTLDEMIDKLKDTRYYDVIYPYRHEDYGKLTFYMEMNLDRLYFDTIHETAQEMSKADRQAFEDAFGENIDILNIEWIYRGLKFYNLSPEELINYTLPYGKHLKFEDLKELCYVEIEEFKKIISRTKYKEMVNEEKDIDLFMGIRVQRHMYNYFKEKFNQGELDISIPNAYLHLLEYEIKDIISILEALKYGLSYYEAKEYLVRDIEGSDY